MAEKNARTTGYGLGSGIHNIGHLGIVIPLFGISLLTAGMAWGDYINPPEWENNPYFTHQSWEFDADANPLAPDSVKHPADNSYGVPLGEIFAPPSDYTADWVDDINAWLPGSDRQGAWAFQAQAPEGTYDAVQFTIPNEANPNLRKELWFQATMWTSNFRGEDPSEIYALLFDAQGNEYSYTSRKLEFFGAPIYGAQWVHVTYRFDIDPQPPLERLVLGAHLLKDEIIVLDQVDIDTRCVPEPGTSMLVVLAGLFGWAVGLRPKRE